jgi:hypothetical protein
VGVRPLHRLCHRFCQASLLHPNVCGQGRIGQGTQAGHRRGEQGTNGRSSCAQVWSMEAVTASQAACTHMQAAS